jgi:hypothetical protein
MGDGTAISPPRRFPPPWFELLSALPPKRTQVSRSVCRRLMTVLGVGPVVALTFAFVCPP